MRIEELDSNFKTKKLENGFIYTEIRDTEAVIEGLCPNSWQRLPDAVLEEVGRPELTELAHHTSGGVIRFRTDASILRLRMDLLQPEFMMSHMPLTGSAGMDVFVDGNYEATFRTELDNPFVEGEIHLKKDAEVAVYLPLYNGVKNFWTGMPEGGIIMPPSPHKIKRSIVFYGSSITQGGCASRTSNAYTALVARWLDAELCCLGFSGNARGNMTVARYIAEMQMSCLVYDYDYNAPDAEFLRNTHAPFLEYILKRNPNLPVLLMSRPNPEHDMEEDECEARREIVRETALKYQREGYQVRFLDGRELFGEESRECCTVDGIHPNDLGFYRMAKAAAAEVKHLIK